MRTKPVVAIDGPAGAGKSTVTRRVADEMGYTRVDTGALYRAVAWLALERATPLQDAEQVGLLARELAKPGATEMSSRGSEAFIAVLGTDVSQAIRSQQVAQAASVVSAHSPVRAALLEVQRQLGYEGGVVLEGRDIGTVVFPDAEAKFYLTASAEVRAARRFEELTQLGQKPRFDVVLAEVRQRDENDTTRCLAPLTRAPDAMVVDSSELTIDQVVAQIVSRVRKVERALAGEG